MPLFNFVKSHLSILDVIGEYVQLKQAGTYWKSPCPFHHEKEASFTVSPDKQIFYCFGCHSGGDLISFIAKAENLSQIEALKFLIERYQLQVPDEIQNSSLKNVGKNADQKKAYFDLCKLVSSWAHQQLLKNNFALNYLNQRHIDSEQIKYFKIGYFPGGVRFVNGFIKDMASQKILVKDLVGYHILMEGRNCLYSPFEERIIFPIKDLNGHYCGFGGRVFKQSDERARYYNSKENAWFAKGQLLFGLDLAKKEMQEKTVAYLVEGYTDCVAMIKHGYKNTIATLGTACTQDHLKILSRYIKTLYVLYDGDQAGQKAILRLTQLCWNVNLELQIVKLPPKEDPASFLDADKDLNKLIKQSRDIISFFIETLGNDFFKSSLSEKMSLSDQIVQVIAKLEDSFKQELLLQQAAMAMQVPIQSLKKMMLIHKDKNLKKQAFKSTFGNLNSKENKVKVNDEEKNTERKGKGIPLLEERIFSAIINNMNNAERFDVTLDLIGYFSSYIQFLLGKFHDCMKKTDSLPDYFNSFLNILEEGDRDWVIKCSLKFDQDVSKDSFEQFIFHFCKQNWKQIVQDMKLKMLKAKQNSDQKKLQELFNLFSKLKIGIQSRGLI